jgi:PST family polysaccharide transporter
MLAMPDIPERIHDGSADPLGHKVRKGLAWSLLNNGLSRAGTTITGIALAHILAPKDFGVYAVALVVCMALLSFNELGVSLAIVQWPGDVGAIVPTVATISIASSAVLYGVCFVIAPWLASGLGTASATGVIRLLCLGVVIDGVVAAPLALIQRDFEQKRRALIDQINFAVGATLTILLAMHGFGAWSLAWGRLAGNTMSILAIVVFTRHRIHVGFDRKLAGRLFRFGVPLAGASLVTFAVLNVDYIIVGATLGPVSLGIYVLAFNLSSWPVNLLSTTVRTVSLAGFSRQQDDPPAVRASFVKALGWLMAVTVPVCALLGGLGHPAINLVYGEKWSRAATVLPFLVILGGCRVAFELAYDYLVAVGRSAVCLLVQALWLVALVVALTSGANLGGIRGVGLGHMVVVLLVTAPAFLIALGRTGIGKLAIFSEVWRPLLAGGAAAAASAAVAGIVTGDLMKVLLGGAVGGVLYLSFVVPAARRQIRGRSAMAAVAVEPS